VLAAKLRTPHRLAERAEVERRSQPCGHRVRGVVAHGVIVSSSPQDGKFPGQPWQARPPAKPDRRCSLLYHRLGTYAEVAKRTGLDPRTSRKYIESARSKRT
jgi:hypothetical protein